MQLIVSDSGTEARISWHARKYKTLPIVLLMQLAVYALPIIGISIVAGGSKRQRERSSLVLTIVLFSLTVCPPLATTALKARSLKLPRLPENEKRSFAYYLTLASILLEAVQISSLCFVAFTASSSENSDEGFEKNPFRYLYLEFDHTAAHFLILSLVATLTVAWLATTCICSFLSMRGEKLYANLACTATCGMNLLFVTSCTAVAKGFLCFRLPLEAQAQIDRSGEEVSHLVFLRHLDRGSELQCWSQGHVGEVYVCLWVLQGAFAATVVFTALSEVCQAIARRRSDFVPQTGKVGGARVQPGQREGLPEIDGTEVPPSVRVFEVHDDDRNPHPPSAGHSATCGSVSLQTPTAEYSPAAIDVRMATATSSSSPRAVNITGGNPLSLNLNLNLNPTAMSPTASERATTYQPGPESFWLGPAPFFSPIHTVADRGLKFVCIAVALLSEGTHAADIMIPVVFIASHALLAAQSRRSKWSPSTIFTRLGPSTTPSVNPWITFGYSMVIWAALTSFVTGPRIFHVRSAWIALAVVFAGWGALLALSWWTKRVYIAGTVQATRTVKASGQREDFWVANNRVEQSVGDVESNVMHSMTVTSTSGADAQGTYVTDDLDEHVPSNLNINTPKRPASQIAALSFDAKHAPDFIGEPEDDSLENGMPSGAQYLMSEITSASTPSSVVEQDDSVELASERSRPTSLLTPATAVKASIPTNSDTSEPLDDTRKKTVTLSRTPTPSPKPHLWHTCDEQEGESEYRVGGYHRVALGEVFNNRYEVLCKLGWGQFSTVWLVNDRTRRGSPTEGPFPSLAALKICKATPEFRKAAAYEVNILQKMTEKLMLSHTENGGYLTRLLDYFEIRGPNGVHMSMVMELLGPDLLKLITGHNFDGIHANIVRVITKNILHALQFLDEEMEIIHTDLKPENILLEIQTESVQRAIASALGCRDPEELERDCDESKRVLKGAYTRHEGESLEEALNRCYKVKVSDFGAARWLKKTYPVDTLQTREYRSPEVLLGVQALTPRIDTWSLACVIFELLTGDFLFDPKRQSEVDIDIYHWMLFQQILEPFPIEHLQTLSGKYTSRYFSSSGTFRFQQLQRYTFPQFIVAKYTVMTADEAEVLVDFIGPMLEFDASKRPSPRQSLGHPWLDVVE
ncbi:serine-theronine protein-kinase [Diplonema papillatum]|nr:serine-theronine protein-kinase [Diplonema papillatum]WGM49949.1 SRPK-B [Diplonema papillatum]